jgi:hypothetical protein
LNVLKYRNNLSRSRRKNLPKNSSAKNFLWEGFLLPVSNYILFFILNGGTKAGKVMNPNLLLEISLIIMVIIVLVYNYFYNRPQPAAIPYEQLRAAAFTATPESLGLAVNHPNQPYGAVMEIGFPGATATQISFSDGTAHFYLSNGENLNGDTVSTPVREAAVYFVRQAQRYLSVMHPVDSMPLPQKGWVRFYVLTQNSVYSAEISERSLMHGESILSNLYEAGHYVITQLHKNKEKPVSLVRPDLRHFGA